MNLVPGVVNLRLPAWSSVSNQCQIARNKHLRALCNMDRVRDDRWKRLLNRSIGLYFYFAPVFPTAEE